jgi:hypothetical protein
MVSEPLFSMYTAGESDAVSDDAGPHDATTRYGKKKDGKITFH